MSREQKMGALTLANQVRVARGKLKRELSLMHSSDALGLLAGLVEDRDHVVEGARLEELLRAPRFMGVGKARKVLREVSVSGDRRFGELSDRQRMVLVHLLRSGRLLPGVQRRVAA